MQPQAVKPLVEALSDTPIADVASSFCDLQEARHRADYDHLAAFPKATAIAHIEDAKRSIEQVREMRPRERQLFFSLVALRARVR